MTQLVKGQKVRVTRRDGTRQLGVVSRDQLAVHPYVTYRDLRTQGEHTARLENVEVIA